MPEIWLGYGESEIILDIKYENILKIISPTYEKMSDVNIQTSILENIEMRESTLVFVTTPFKLMLPVIKVIQNQLMDKKIDHWEICVISSPFSHRIRQMLLEEKINLIRISPTQLKDKLSTFKNIIIIDKLEFDPIFGFSGTHSRLIRQNYPEVMNEIYPLFIGEVPKPGQHTEALKIAMEVVASTNYQMINVISDNEGIDSLFFGSTVQAFLQTTSYFKAKSIVRSERSKSVIISGRSSFKIQRNLGDSLNLLWNNFHAVSQNGTVILLSESKEGIGNDALAKYIEGRLDLSGLNKYNYINDIEHLNFLQILKEKYEIILISTIPQVYLNKLGLKSIQKIQDGLSHVIRNYGKNLKINIIPNSDFTLVTNDS